MTLLAWVLAAMSILAPGRDHAEVGGAIAKVLAAEPPLFKDDADRHRTAALVVAIAFRESSFRNSAVSRTNDHCSMQVHARPDLTLDTEACIRVGLGMLRDSLRLCGAPNPLGVYAAGNCDSEHGKRISNDRMWLARRLVREVQP